MSEILPNCEAHPVSDPIFKRAVLRTLVARQVLRVSSRPTAALASTRISELSGSDTGLSDLVNDCADIIESGDCRLYEFERSGVNVNITRRKAGE